MGIGPVGRGGRSAAGEDRRCPAAATGRATVAKGHQADGRAGAAATRCTDDAVAGSTATGGAAQTLGHDARGPVIVGGDDAAVGDVDRAALARRPAAAARSGDKSGTAGPACPAPALGKDAVRAEAGRVDRGRIVQGDIAARSGGSAGCPGDVAIGVAALAAVTADAAGDDPGQTGRHRLDRALTDGDGPVDGRSGRGAADDREADLDPAAVTAVTTVVATNTGVDIADIARSAWEGEAA